MEANLSLMYVISLFSVLIAFAFAAYLFLWVRRQKSTNARINEVAALIKEGANTFMRKEYRVLSIFAGIAAVIIFLLLPSPVWTGHPGRNLSMAAAYVAGTALNAVVVLMASRLSDVEDGPSVELLAAIASKSEKNIVRLYKAVYTHCDSILVAVYKDDAKVTAKVIMKMTQKLDPKRL